MNKCLGGSGGRLKAEPRGVSAQSFAGCEPPTSCTDVSGIAHAGKCTPASVPQQAIRGLTRGLLLPPGGGGARLDRV